jgi:hypothetical protein
MPVFDARAAQPVAHQAAASASPLAPRASARMRRSAGSFCTAQLALARRTAAAGRRAGQFEARLLALVHGIAAQHGGVEAAASSALAWARSGDFVACRASA